MAAYQPKFLISFFMLKGTSLQDRRNQRARVQNFHHHLWKNYSDLLSLQ